MAVKCNISVTVAEHFIGIRIVYKYVCLILSKVADQIRKKPNMSAGQNINDHRFERAIMIAILAYLLIPLNI